MNQVEWHCSYCMNFYLDWSKLEKHLRNGHGLGDEGVSEVKKINETWQGVE